MGEIIGIIFLKKIIENIVYFFINLVIIGVVMKKLIMDNFENEYSIEVNNCLDYKIAGASSVFNKYFLRIYCAQWSIYTNWTDYDNYEIQKIILNNLGLKKEKIKVSKKNIIYAIKVNIDSGYPVLLSVATNTLFFSIVYKIDKSKNLIHNLLITGYDDEKQIIYIRENSINKDFFYKYFKSHPFMEYQLTYDMINEIYENNCVIFYKYENNCIEVIKKIKNRHFDELKIETYNLLTELLSKKNDQLSYKIFNMINKESYDKKFLGEQYHRNYFQSINTILSLLYKEIGINVYESEIVEKFLNNREYIINSLTKMALKDSKFEKKSLLNYIDLLNQNNENFAKFLSDYKVSVDISLKTMDNNLLLVKDTKIITDSNMVDENEIEYSANCFLLRQNYITDNNYWLSEANDNVHWLKVEFPKIFTVNIISIEFSRYIDSICSDYDVLYSIDGVIWNLIKSIKNNDKSVNEIAFNGVYTKQILIRFLKNNNFENKTIVRSLFVFGL